MQPDIVLAADSIVKSFGTRHVLRAASLWVRAGSITAIVGRNGSGKSTMLRCICGLIAADGGIVRFGGNTYLRPRLARLARDGLFYLPQDPLLAPMLSVRQQLSAVSTMFGSDRFDVVTEMLGVTDVLDQMPITLSGGERRRVDIAAALLRQPRCLLADEPLARIDPRDREVIAAAFRALAAEGTAIAFTGHEVEDVLALADDVVWVTSGTTRSLGAPSFARQNHAFVREYLGWK